MEIQLKDLGKIVELPVKPDWGPGIISKIENRFALIIFRDTKEKAAKKYLLAENPLKWAANQDDPALTKRARAKNKKIKAPVTARPPL